MPRKELINYREKMMKGKPRLTLPSELSSKSEYKWISTQLPIEPLVGQELNRPIWNSKGRNFESNLELGNFSDLSNVRFLFSAYERATTLLSIAWLHTALTVLKQMKTEQHTTQNKRS